MPKGLRINNAPQRFEERGMMVDLGLAHPHLLSNYRKLVLNRSWLRAEKRKNHMDRSL